MYSAISRKLTKQKEEKKKIREEKKRKINEEKKRKRNEKQKKKEAKIQRGLKIKEAQEQKKKYIPSSPATEFF